MSALRDYDVILLRGTWSSRVNLPFCAGSKQQNMVYPTVPKKFRAAACCVLYSRRGWWPAGLTLILTWAAQFYI